MAGHNDKAVEQAGLAGLNPKALIILYVALALTPLLLAWLQDLPSRNFFREFSSGLVMVGFAMMLLQFIHSGRFRGVSGRVGIDLTMRFHQLAAWAVLLFIVVHPLLYAAPRLTPEPLEALTALNRMFASPGLRSGVIAWYLLIALVLLAVLRDRLPVRYELWRLSHGVGAILIAVLSLEHTLRVGTYSSGGLLPAFWLLLTAIALLSLLHVYLIKPLLQLRRPYRLVENRLVAERTWQLVLEPEQGAAIDFLPGQFAWLNLGHSSFSLTEHPFSISSAPCERPRIAFTIKQSGDFTDGIGAIPVGTRAYLDGPHGAFALSERPQAGVVLLAGGVGFAPMIGMLRQLAAEGYKEPVTLVYGNREASQILYRDELEQLQKKLALDLCLVLSEAPADWHGRVGQLDGSVLRQCLDFDPRKLYFVCGPVAMMNEVERCLLDSGVPPAAIVLERFKYQ